MILMDLIKKKVQEKERRKRESSPNDAIVNPLSEFKTVAQKRAAFNSALDHRAVAYIDFNETILLGTSGAEFNDVEFIGGLWRVQRPFNHETVRSRDGREFVLGEKLPHQEHTKFDFFKAYMVAVNCYGRYIAENKSGDYYVMARYETNRGTFWAYGKTISDARAFLAIKVYDEYQDVIEDEIQRNRARVK